MVQPTISKIFSGSHNPSTEILHKLCGALGFTLPGIMEEIDSESSCMVGYLATPLTAVVGKPRAERELKRIVGEIKRIASDPEFSDPSPGFEIYWPGDHTHPMLHAQFKPSQVYLKDRSTASTFDFLIILCAEPSYGVGQENEIATQAGVPAIRLVPGGLSRMMAGSFIASYDVQFQGDLTTGITFDEAELKKALHWARRMRFKHKALYAQVNGKSFGVRLRGLISDRYGDERKFADELGIALHYLLALMEEPIAVTNPSLRLLQRISTLLQASVGYLMDEKENSDPVWVESNVSWQSWIRDDTPKDGRVAMLLRDEWRAEYYTGQREESLTSSRRAIKAMTPRDWEKRYQRRTRNGKAKASGTLF